MPRANSQPARIPGSNGRRAIVTRACYLTPRELALALVVEELRRRRLALPAPSILDGQAWRTAATTALFAARSPASSVLPRTTMEIEPALGCLAGRGLVEESLTEGQVSRVRPQLYRWAKCATTRQLELFAERGLR